MHNNIHVYQHNFQTCQLQNIKQSQNKEYIKMYIHF